MNKNKYPLLFSPIRVGSMTVKNRIFMSAMTTALCTTDNLVTDRVLAYYEARMKGGAGLITTECVMVDENSHYSTPRNMGLYRDDQIPGMAKLAKLAHSYGTKIVPQLLHGGPAAVSELNDGRQPVAASAIPLRNVGEMPREMTVEEIHALTQRFADAAWRAKQAGFDGVEIHACHRHGVLGTFLSPQSNKRVDEYGGNLHGRMRFLLEVVDAVKARNGKDFPVIVRMSMSEYEPGGQSFLDGIYIARTLEEHGVDLLNLSDATLENYWRTVTPSGTPKGVNTELAAKLKETVGIPIGVIGRNNEPWAAELVLALGRTDAVYMGRALLCDPEFPNKAQQGRDEEIRPCIGCTDCITHAHGPEIRCTMNPLAGRETECAAPAGQRKKILVAGGGPGGLQAAAELARRGHQVILAEKSSRLGGQMYLAAIPISKQDISHGVKYLIGQAYRTGVEVLLNTEVTEVFLKELQPDAVVVATGGEAVIPGFLRGAPQVVNAWDVLDGKVAVGQNIVVIGGGAVGCETAEFLVHPNYDLSPRGKRVTLIEMTDNLMTEDRSYARFLLVRRMVEKHCNILLNAKVERVEERQVVYSQDGVTHTIPNVDTVIAALGSRPAGQLEQLTKQLGIPNVVIGAAVRMGHIYDAIMEGQLAAEKL